MSPKGRDAHRNNTALFPSSCLLWTRTQRDALCFGQLLSFDPNDNSRPQPSFLPPFIIPLSSSFLDCNLRKPWGLKKKALFTDHLCLSDYRQSATRYTAGQRVKPTDVLKADRDGVFIKHGINSELDRAGKEPEENLKLVYDLKSMMRH